MGRRRGITIPARTLPEVVDVYPMLRQSLLGRMDNCSLSTLFDLETPNFSSHPQARGTIGHRAAGEILRTLRRTGEVSMPVAEALEILYECAAQRDVPDDQLLTLPVREQRLLRIAIVRLVTGPDLTMTRLEDVERRLWMTVRYPEMRRCGTCGGMGRVTDGAPCRECGGSGRIPTGATVERVVTGQPDALVWDPPDGMIVLDWKFSWGVPSRGRDVDPSTGQRDEHIDDPDHVSYMGYFQQRMYALLVMKGSRIGETAPAYPAVDRVVLREFYPLVTEARWGSVLRSDLERVEREIATLAELTDRGLQGGSKSQVWQPSPGKHCAFCDAPNRCPLTADAKMLNGGIGTIADADRYAREWIVVQRLNTVLRSATKAWVEARGPIYGRSDKGRWALRWKGEKGRRTFGFTVPDESDRGPKDPNLESVFKDVAQRAKKAA